MVVVVVYMCHKVISFAFFVRGNLYNNDIICMQSCTMHIQRIVSAIIFFSLFLYFRFFLSFFFFFFFLGGGGGGEGQYSFIPKLRFPPKLPD